MVLLKLVEDNPNLLDGLQKNFFLIFEFVQLLTLRGSFLLFVFSLLFLLHLRLGQAYVQLR